MTAARFALILFVTATAAGCGVKGDPIPPSRPAELGRGRPTYRRATEKIQMRRLPPKEDATDQDRDSESSDEDNDQ